ncbi:hypothetical protein GBAR_LOCUS24876 [Geodia barretti]|nr:hypothetical protein GBAR_LOCUS24876 [Geodia barretti]
MLKQLRCEGSKSEGLYTRTVPLGSAICVNVKSIDRRKLIVLPTGDYDSHKSDLNHVLQLERLGSLQTDSSHSDSCLIYPSSVTRSHTLDIPMSPPYYSSTRGSINQGKDGNLCPLPHPGSRLRHLNDTPSPLWSPYVLSQNLADDQIEEDTFTNQVGGMSVRSEHRRLRQSSRPTPDSVDTRNSKLSPSRSVLSRITRSRSGNSQGNSEITGSQSGNSEITRSRSGNSEITRSRSDSLQESQSAHPNIIMIEAEIHEDCISSQPPTGHSENDRDENEKEESAHLLVDASDGVKRKPAGGSDSRRNLDLVLENNNRGNLPDERGEKAQENADANPDSKKDQLSLEFRGSSGGSEMILTLEYRRELETAFVTNHLYGNTPQSIAEAAHTITLQAQMYLQRLNYLSVSYKITGEYDDITLNAVKTFQGLIAMSLLQRAHNHHEAQFSVVVPETGHLSPTTYQFLRQAYITIYASMVRIGLDKYLGDNFNPMSTAPRDIRVFRECVSGLQRSQGLKECQSGAMCANTIHRIKQLLHAQKKVTV